MAGSITTSNWNKPQDGIRGLTIAYATDSAGDLNGNTFGLGWGRIDAVKFRVNSLIPDSGYDCVCYDADSVDVFNGVGANLTDKNLAGWKYPILPGSGAIAFTGDTLELNIQNAGNVPRVGEIIILLS